MHAMQGLCMVIRPQDRAVCRERPPGVVSGNSGMADRSGRAFEALPGRRVCLARSGSAGNTMIPGAAWKRVRAEEIVCSVPLYTYSCVSQARATAGGCGTGNDGNGDAVLTFSNDQTEQLLRRAAGGDQIAMDRLLDTHRDRLKRMVALRMDRRIRARTDPSDVVQDALLMAHGKLATYLREQPVLFYPWLRQIAWEQLIQHTRRHLGAAARTVLREEELEPGLSDASAALLSQRLADSLSGPESHLHKREQRARIKATLALLSPEHREVLALRFLEELSLAEVAAVLGLREPAVRGRQFRAIQRLQSLLADLEI